MATLTSQLIVRLIDGISGPAQAAAQALRRIGAAANSVRGGGIAALQQRLNAAVAANNAAIAEARGKMMDAVGGFLVLRKAMTDIINPAISFESAMADVAKVSGFDDAGLEKFGRQLRQVAANEIPMAVNQLAALAAAAAQAGIADEDLLDFTKLTARAAVAWDMTGAEAGEALAKIKTQLGLTVQETQTFADAINHLSDNTASSSRDLIDFSRRVAAQGEFFGFAKEQTLAFGAAMVSAGATPEVAATSFQNMGRALTKGASATKRVAGAFRRLGLDARKVAKAMQKDALGTTIKVMERLGQLPEYMQASVMSDLFGDEARALSPLLGRLDILKDTYKLVADESAYAASVSREFERRAATTEFALEKFYSRIREIALTIGGMFLPTIKQTLDVLGPMALQIAALAERFPGLTKAAIMAVGGLVALRIAVIGLQWGALLAKGGLLNLMAVLLRSVAISKGAAMLMLMPFLAYGRRMVGVFQIVAMRFGMMMAAFRAGSIGIGGVLAGIGATGARALLSLLNPMALVRAAFIALKWAVIGTGIGAVVVALAMAGTWIYNNWSGIKAMFAGIGEGLMSALGPAQGIIQPVVEWIGNLAGKLQELAGPVNMTEEQWRQLGVSIGKSIGDAVNSIITKLQALLTWVMELPGRIVAAFVDLGERLYNAGADIIQRLWDGMKAKFAELIGWVKAKASELAHSWSFGLIGSAPSAQPSSPSAQPSSPSAPAAPAARATGGPVHRGQTYVVGERQPELFTPSRDGYVHPSVGARAAATINAPIEIKIVGVSDPKAAAEEAYRILEARTRDLFRGAMADVGLKFT